MIRTIEITDSIESIIENLSTQDNLCTQHPSWCVKGLRRIYGIDPLYSDQIVWLDEENNEVEAPEDEDNPPRGWHETGYVEEWETIQVFLTHDAAKSYIESSLHRHTNYEELQIFCDSFYRNEEMIAVREFLSGLKRKQIKLFMCEKKTMSYYESLLDKACIFFDNEDVADTNPTSRYINLNDAFYYAAADMEEVKEGEMNELGKLFLNYGMCGVYFWVVVIKRMKKHGYDTPDYKSILNYVITPNTAEQIFCVWCNIHSQNVFSSEPKFYQKWFLEQLRENSKTCS